MKCLICKIEKSSKGKACKLCGMRSENSVHYTGYSFCCNKCVNYFKKIISKTPVSKRKEIMEKDVVI